MSLLYGIAALAFLWWLLTAFAQASPAAMAKTLRLTGAALALGSAAFMGLRGRIDIALALGGLGAWLLGWNSFGLGGLRSGTQTTAGRVSRVRSSRIEMELDHDTGEMDGLVLAGTFSGQRLNALDEESLRKLLMECRTEDPDGLRLLAAYLDRRFPQWRETAGENAESQSGERSSSGAMSEEEAYQVLGLQPGANLVEIKQAHRTLMKKLHPDQGGSTYLAARVNQAKETLLRRHR